MGSTAYEQYARDLSLLAASIRRDPWDRVEQDVHAALNGHAARMLRTLVPLEFRRQTGAFFTSGPARDRFADLLAPADDAEQTAVFWDPTCGAGDLLLAAADTFPIRNTLSATLRAWNRSLHGHELQPAFAEVARLRLFIAAAARHRARGDKVRTNPEAGSRAFNNVHVSDGLAALRTHKRFKGHIVLNPPFGPVQADAGCDWSSGMTSQAGIFFLEAAMTLAFGGTITAILPDVLRSGSRYRYWRERVSKLLEIKKISPFGRFDRYTNVDVFLLQGRRLFASETPSAETQWWRSLNASAYLEDLFNVRVGSVVDNRDPHEGREAPFLTARCMPPSGQMEVPERRRKYSGRLITPPFVAVRRTSRPNSDGSSRVRGVLLTGDEPIAVDNHLITLSPKSGNVDECFRLLEILASDEVAMWLDERIRCRHLTVGIIRSIPWR
ncbi:DNA methyltransferase family protein [Actinoallomurus soli]|uniref:hypothetical protein n=1 Tax=Actinoallomurus soli TaxID=2952535 RepID=UPI0020923EAB|nr:hypothetical protein [Actinoallomurus soli]MCO5968249.1 hypothetical protein [Actinoallomurus soli]